MLKAFGSFGASLLPIGFKFRSTATSLMVCSSASKTHAATNNLKCQDMVIMLALAATIGPGDVASSPEVMPLMLPPSHERMVTQLSNPALLVYGCALGNVKVGSELILDQ